MDDGSFRKLFAYFNSRMENNRCNIKRTEDSRADPIGNSGSQYLSRH